MKQHELIITSLEDSEARDVNQYKSWMGLFDMAPHEVTPLDYFSDCLDYVRTVANHELPQTYNSIGNDGKPHVFNATSLDPTEFIKIYNWGLIDESTKQPLYYGNNDLQGMIKARGLDPEKLWYLILWVKNVSETTKRAIHDPLFADISELKQVLSSASDTSNDCELAIIKGRKKLVTIKNQSTLEYIRRALSVFTDREFSVGLDISRFMDIEAHNSEKPLEMKYKLFIFYDLLYPYLKEHKPDRVKNQWQKDSKYFLGLLAYAVGLSDDKNLLEYWTTKDDLPTERHTLNGLLSGVSRRDMKTFTNPYYNILREDAGDRFARFIKDNF